MAVSDAVTGHIRPDVEEEAPCFFWKLPLEVRDMIYELLYGHGRPLKVVTRVGWKDREKVRQRLSKKVTASTTFPHSPLKDILVSKQYLDEAARIYVKSKSFVFPTSADLLDALKKGCIINRTVLHHMSSVQVHAACEFGILILMDLARVSTIEVGFDEAQLEIDDEKVPRRDDYSDLDLIRIPVVAELLQLRGLKDITVKEAFALDLDGPERRQRVDQLLSRIQQLLTSVVTQSKGPKNVEAKVQSVQELLAGGVNLNDRRASYEPVEVRDDTNGMLAEENLPQNESEFIKLFFSRPHALYNHIKHTFQRV